VNGCRCQLTTWLGLIISTEGREKPIAMHPVINLSRNGLQNPSIIGFREKCI